MKKLLCIMLTGLLLLSAVYWPRAAAAVNYCRDFEDAINILRRQAPYWDIVEEDAFPVASVMHYTKQMLCREEYGEELIAEGSYHYYARYAIPADVFEAAAMDFFAAVDISALRSYTSFFWDHNNLTGIDNFRHYQEDRGVYLFSNYGDISDYSQYQVLGYTEENGRYRVYSRFVSQIWGLPDGVEGQDYIVIDGNAYAIVHYLETVMEIQGGRVRFHTWDQIDRLPEGVELTTPLTVFTKNETVTIQAAEGVFDADTVISLSSPEEESLQRVSAALGEGIVDFVAYDITATAQPNGLVQVTFAIPEGFDPQYVALFHISEDGQAQRLEAAVNPDAGTVTAQLTHFSLYAVAQLVKPTPLQGDVNGDGCVDARDARVILRYLVDMVDENQVNLSLADVNGDGCVDARDARAILRQLVEQE